MKLAYDNDTLVENKALILYILDKIGKPISNTALLKLNLLYILFLLNVNLHYLV